MTIGYVLRRLILFVVVIIAAATVNFAIPRLAPGDPIGAVLEELSSRGQRVEGAQAMIDLYRARFGLDLPLWQQYLNYVTGVLFHFDLGYSIAFFPAKVEDMLFMALPWTIGLLVVANLMAFGFGTLLGALLSWPKSPSFLRGLVPIFMPLSATPYYLLGLILIYVLAFSLGLFPLGGAHRAGVTPTFTWSFIRDVLYHGALPALSIVLAGVGFWALSMRGTMVSILGEDYLALAEAKGLPNRRIFLWYGMRNALLPQTTALAIALGQVVSGAVLVEVVFSYPGVGWLLYNALRTSDYLMVQGIAFFLIVSVAVAVLILDLVYPKLDPRITS